jgi:hypothetical protein
MAPALVRAAPIERRDRRGRRAQHLDRDRLCRVRSDGRILAPIMPWRSISHLTKSDAQAIAVYLNSLPPVHNKVPGPLGARLCSLCASRARGGAERRAESGPSFRRRLRFDVRRRRALAAAAVADSFLRIPVRGKRWSRVENAVCDRGCWRRRPPGCAATAPTVASTRNR